MSKFEEIAKTTAQPTSAPTAPKGAPIEVSERLGGRQSSGEASVLADEVALTPFPLTQDQREELKGRLATALTAFAMLAPIPNAETIPFLPDAESRNVTERIAQGPYVYRSMAEKRAKEYNPTPVSWPTRSAEPKLAHPDMSKPGRTIKGDSPPYRPL